MVSTRYKEYWNDRYRGLPLNLSLPISIVAAFRFNAIRLLVIHLSPLRPLMDSAVANFIAGAVSVVVYFLCVLCGAIELIKWHDKRVYEKRFTEEERERLKIASDMAYDYWPKEATEEATNERDNLRIERCETSWLELHLRKGFTPLDVKGITVGAVRQRREQIEQELYQNFYPKKEIDSITPDSSGFVTAQTLLLFRKALGLVNNDEQLKGLTARMKELSTGS
jgi:hypothetical protein